MSKRNMMRNRIINTLLILLIGIKVYSQPIDEVLDKMNAIYNGSNAVQYQMKYNLYENYTSDVVKESYTGYYLKTASKELYMKINNTEFILSKKLSVKVNHDDKEMLVSTVKGIVHQNIDIATLKASCDIKSFTKYNNYWKIVLVPKELTSLNYSKIVLKIGKDYRLQKQEFFYNVPMNFSNSYKSSITSRPRLEVIYSNTSNLKPSLVNTNAFVMISKSNKIICSNKYKSYKVFDYRNSSIN